MKIQFRLILFFALLLWTCGVFYECLINRFNILVYGYPIIQKTYSIVCHQNPEKVILLYCGKTLVCARCFGIYIGLLVSSIVFLFYIPKVKRSLTILLIALIPLLIDVIATTINIYAYSKALAFATGLLFGSVLFLYLYNGLENLVYEIDKR